MGTQDELVICGGCEADESSESASKSFKTAPVTDESIDWDALANEGEVEQNQKGVAEEEIDWDAIGAEIEKEEAAGGERDEETIDWDKLIEEAEDGEQKAVCVFSKRTGKIFSLPRMHPILGVT